MSNITERIEEMLVRTDQSQESKCGLSIELRRMELKNLLQVAQYWDQFPPTAEMMAEYKKASEYLSSKIRELEKTVFTGMDDGWNGRVDWDD